MKHLLLTNAGNRMWRISLLGCLIAMFSLSANATSLLTENFDYNSGNLVGQGDWAQYLTLATFPIQVQDLTLTYPSYTDDATGKSIKLDKKQGQDAVKNFEKQTSGSIYMSALVNISEFNTDASGEYILSFGDGTNTGTTKNYGKLFVRKSPNDKIQFGINRSGAVGTVSWNGGEYESNTTILVVIKYTFVDDIRNDKASLFVNPAVSSNEPTATTESGEEFGADPTGIGSVVVNQGSNSKSPAASIDAIRVATTWSDLFPGASEVKIPSIKLTPASFNFGNAFGGESYTKTINVKGSDLKGDITIGGMITGELSTSVSTITKAEAEAEGGYNLTVTLTPSDEFAYTDTVKFISQDMDMIMLRPMWTTIIPIETANLKALRDGYNPNDPGAGWYTYRVNGEVTVSHVYNDGSQTYLYVQDENGSFTIQGSFGSLTTVYKTGDKIKGMVGSIESSFGSIFLLPSKDFGAPVSSDNEIIVTPVTLAELAATPANYEGRLIKVTDVTFPNRATENEGFFAEVDKNGNKVNHKIAQNGVEASMRVFKGADFIGDAIPETATLIGISTTGRGDLIAPRSKADIVVAVTPEEAFSLHEDFNGDSMPQDWISSKNGWKHNTSEGKDYSGGMYINNAANSYLVTPVLDLSKGGYSITFDYKWNPVYESGAWEANAELVVSISTDNGSTYNKLTTLKEETKFKEKTISLSAYTSATCKLRFEYNITDAWLDGGSGVIDNVVITTPLVGLDKTQNENLNVYVDAAQTLYVNAATAIQSVRVFNMNGAVVARAINTGNSFSVPMQQMSKGLLIVEVITAEGRTVAKVMNK